MRKAQYVISSVINFRLTMAERMGANKEVIIKRSGIDPGLLSNPTALVSLEQERTIWRIMVEETGRQDIGLICGINFPLQSMGVIGYLMLKSSSIGHAIKKLCRYQRLIGDAMGMHCKEDQHYFSVFITLWTDWSEELRYTMDLLLTSCMAWSERYSQGSVRPIRVGINYPEPDNHQHYDRSFAPAPITYAVNESYLIFNKGDMEQPILPHSGEKFEFYDKHFNEVSEALSFARPFSSQVAKCMAQNIINEVFGIETVAEQLGIDLPTLERQLKSENTSYPVLYNEVRKEIAIQHLKKRLLNKSEIAFVLGFLDLGDFSRSFKKWTGYKPSDFPL